VGIRIHKALGYALTDVKCKDHEIIDDRFNPKGYMHQRFDEDEEEKFTLDGYIEFCKVICDGKIQGESFSALIEYQACERLKEWQDSYRWSPYNTIIHDTEGGLSNVCLIIPPGNFKDWRRYDDLIDYHEEKETQKDLIPRVLDISKGIYPYEVFRNKEFYDPTKYEKPKVPDCVKFTCRYFNLFKDEAIIDELKPILYVWWS